MSSGMTVEEPVCTSKSQKEEKREWVKIIFEKATAEKFPKLAKDITL